MDKIVNKHVSYIYDEKKRLVSYDLKVGGGKEQAYKMAYMMENGWSYADGFKDGWKACCEMLLSLTDILQRTGDERSENLMHLQEYYKDNPEW